MSITIYAPNLDVRFRLERLLTKHVDERAELLAEGVARHRVDALYPLDFERIIRLVGERFEIRGAGHLISAAIPKAEWGTIAHLIYELLRDMEDGQTDACEAEWKAHYGPAAANLKFYQLTYKVLNAHYFMPDATNFTGRAGRALFMSYWLLTHPQVLAAQEAKGQQLMEWTVTKLLGHHDA